MRPVHSARLFYDRHVLLSLRLVRLYTWISGRSDVCRTYGSYITCICPRITQAVRTDLLPTRQCRLRRGAFVINAMLLMIIAFLLRHSCFIITSRTLLRWTILVIIDCCFCFVLRVVPSPIPVCWSNIARRAEGKCCTLLFVSIFISFRAMYVVLHLIDFHSLRVFRAVRRHVKMSYVLFCEHFLSFLTDCVILALHVFLFNTRIPVKLMILLTIPCRCHPFDSQVNRC
jgi:hypothetical protein